MGQMRVGINGMGRIGRTILKEWFNRKINNFDIVAVNNPGESKRYTHLLKYDSVHGVHPANIQYENGELHFDDKKLKFYNCSDPSEIPWSDQDIDLVIDGTGVFRDKPSLSKHISGSVKKVIICAPGQNLDGTFVMGINHNDYDETKHHIVSNASCTTNCLAPVAKVLHDEFEILSGFMTTIHAYTLDQMTLDSAHKDMRRARAAAVSMIPTTTGAASALGEVIPTLKGKLDGYAVRVPTPDVSMVDLSVKLKKPASVEEINQAMEAYSQDKLKDILAICDLPLVSVDFTGRRESSIIDLALTQVIEDQAKVVAWYDNEVGFSNRVIDLAQHMGGQF